MTDWRFGDVLRLPENGGHDTYAVFLVRPWPFTLKPDGAVECWGFSGLYLAPTCPTAGYPACGYGHFTGERGSFGGHPDAWGNHWVLVESLG